MLLPAFQQFPQPEQYNNQRASSDGSSPRVLDLPSSGGSSSSFTTYASTTQGGALGDSSRTTSPEKKPIAQHSNYQLASSIHRPEYSMATTQHQYAPTHGYLDSHHLNSSHMSHDGGNSTSYSSYQPPVLPSSLPSYAQSYAQNHYPYATAPMSSSHHYSGHSISIPSIGSFSSLSQPSLPSAETPSNYVTDATGQTPPANSGSKKHKITATLWEDEGTLCFQVEANGICVARRADNCFINGTKLLNVANMTRGRRDGLLKGEKNRKVVKIGPMHLKGVWIPFERALDYANKEKIVDQLYPLFVNNVEGFLTNTGHHPAVGRMATASGRDYGHVRNSSTMSQVPSMHSASSSMSLAQPMSAHHIHGRPSIDRAYTLPEPTTSTTAMATSANGSYDWNNPTTQQASHATVTTAKSLPTSPATTPLENTLQQLQYPSAQVSYDTSRPMYSMPAPPYALAPAHHGYGKTDMLPPPPRKVEYGVKDENETQRPDSGYTVNGSESRDRSYTTYQGPMSGQQHVKEQRRSGSPDDGTPRANTSVPQQPQWQPQQQNVYTTPQRMMPADYRPMSAHSTHSSHSAQHAYSTSGNFSASGGNYSASGGNYSASGTPTGPPAFYYPSNGATPTPATTKRLRDIDEDEEDQYSRPQSQGGDYDGGLKRRRTVREGSSGAPRLIAQPGLNRARSVMYQRR